MIMKKKQGHNKKWLLFFALLIIFLYAVRDKDAVSDGNKPVDSEMAAAGAENTDTESIQTENIDTESIDTENTGTENTDAESADTEKINTEKVDAGKYATAKKTEETVKASELKRIDTVKVTISAAGDCTLGIDSRYSHNFNHYYSQNGAAYFLQGVKNYFEKDDITIVNFEGTLTESQNRANKTFTFKGDASYTDILKKGAVDVVNLANNHSFDFGQQGFDDTVQNLKNAKIPYCYNQTIAYRTVNGVKVAFLGFSPLNGATKQQIKEGIAKAKQKKAKIIIVSCHWGIERQYYPNGTQEEIGRYAIDQGADLVIGHHPHVLQGIERYKGRYIVYSLGNFCFGGNSNPADKDTMIFRQTFYVKKGKLLMKDEARVIPCALSSVTYTNDFQPKALTGNEKARLIQKLNQLSDGRGVHIKSNGKITES